GKIGGCMVVVLVLGASGMLAACTRPLTAVALASTAAVPRKPLREIMGILVVQRAPASPADTARGFGRLGLLPHPPPPALPPLRSTVASQKSRLASMAVMVAAMRWRASASSENTSISIAL